MSNAVVQELVLAEAKAKESALKVEQAFVMAAEVEATVTPKAKEVKQEVVKAVEAVTPEVKAVAQVVEVKVESLAKTAADLAVEEVKKAEAVLTEARVDRKSTRLNSSNRCI